MEKVKEILGEVLHLLYPKQCPFCGKVLELGYKIGEYPLCSHCREEIVEVKEPVCKKCGKMLQCEEEEFCADCIKNPHLFLQGKAMWLYKEKVKASIYRFKYADHREYGKAYAQCMVEKYGNWILENQIQVLLPVPLHRNRLLARGYNQAAIVAKEMGYLMHLPVDTGLLRRVVDTKPQKALNDRERKKNIKNAFKIVTNDVKWSTVLVIDDIYTTGSTVDAVSLALKMAGIENIYVMSISIGRGY